MQFFLIPVLDSNGDGVGGSLGGSLNCLCVRAPARDLVEFLILLSKSDVLSHISFRRKQKERDSSPQHVTDPVLFLQALYAKCSENEIARRRV